jgi:hypothetical protein
MWKLVYATVPKKHCHLSRKTVPLVLPSDQFIRHKCRLRQYLTINFDQQKLPLLQETAAISASYSTIDWFPLL